MKPLHTLQLLYTFYKNFIFISAVITGGCTYLFWKWGANIIAVLCWLKVITMVLTFLFVNSYKKKEYYYYQNLGVSKKVLWIYTISFDIALFIFLLFQITKFK
jgi:hypothetical protein